MKMRIRRTGQECPTSKKRRSRRAATNQDSLSDEVVITIQITGSNIEDSGVQELERSRATKQTQSETAFSSQRLQHLKPAVMERSMSST